MTKIEITLIDAQNGQSYPAEVVTDKPVGWWIDQILQAVGLPREEQGKRIGYQFVVERTGKVISEEETLQDADLQSGDSLRLERAKAAASPRPITRTKSLLGWGCAAFGLFLPCGLALLSVAGWYLLDIQWFSPRAAPTASFAAPTIEVTPAAPVNEARPILVEDIANLAELTTVADAISTEWLMEGRALAVASFGKIWVYSSSISEGGGLAESYSLSFNEDSSPEIFPSPDGKRFAAIGAFDCVIFDAESGTELIKMERHGWGEGEAWSPDSRLFAVPSESQQIQIWDVENQTMTIALDGHSEFIEYIEWSPDGQRLASASKDKTVRIWDAPTGVSSATLEFERPRLLPEILAWSPNSRWLFAYSLMGCSECRNSYIFDAETGREVELRVEAIGHLDWGNWLPDSRFLVRSGLLPNPRTHLVDVVTGNEMAHFDGLLYAHYLASNQSLLFGRNDNRMYLLDAENLQVQITIAEGLEGTEGDISGVSSSPDGRILTLASRQRTTSQARSWIYFWNAETGEMLRTIPFDGEVRDLTWSLDGSALLIHLWDQVSKSQWLSVWGIP